MRYEFSWSGEHGEPRRFTSGCPHVAEIMLLSGSDIPQMPTELQAAFRARFGQVRGELEKLLRSHAEKPSSPRSIESGVPSFTIRISDDDSLGVVQ